MRLLWIVPLVLLAPFALAIRLIESKALSLCSSDAGITSNHFSVVFTPQNQSLALAFDGISALSGKVTAELILSVYGYTALRRTLDPCDMGLEGLCPLHAGAFPVMTTNIKVPDDVVSQIPGIAYTVPDLDATVRVYINSTETGKSISCIEATLSNGKIVYQPGVGWATAVISGLGVAVSSVTSGLGHSKAATHIGTNVLALFAFMQSQAMIGMTSVHMPPIVQSWTQNFQWSMGVIHVGFLEKLCTWYQRSTGGEPSTVLANLSKTSIHVLKKRHSAYPIRLDLVERDSAAAIGNTEGTIVRGIQRVGFRAHIEPTNIFLTGLIFFIGFVTIVMLLFLICKTTLVFLMKSGKIKPTQQLQEMDWTLAAKGIFFRLIFIGFLQMCILCLWEFTQNDSPAEVVLAVVMLVSCVVTVGVAVLRVVAYAKQSITLHNNPAYVLYSNPICLNKWGIMYTQYQATAYYFLVVQLAYTVVKSLFISLSQPAPIVLTVALVIIETTMLLATSILRPWMNRNTNVCNLAIASINMVNSIFLLIFSDVFDQPPIISGVMGVVFFVYNCAFVLILLIIVLVASAYAVASKNPDTRYQPMRDDRDSFLQSRSTVQLTTELDALGATARGDVKLLASVDNDNSENPTPGTTSRPESSNSKNELPLSHGGNTEHDTSDESLPPLPNVSDLSVPLFPSETARRSPSILRGESPATVNSLTALTAETRRAQNSPSPWLRGAGYENA
ncbi:hypothetical protein FE257_000731 [Aspergillus nanangensis]|uniref:ML-like domain-containing protein n=1 Tax=Aspergillus nanangensis TaxID=2582783 RepID=A0AAD4CEM4_ASPNN|nr:hypothetical protein FE257_000731 [Aspergillus nanangensis]